MTQDQLDLLKKARDSILAARLLLDNRFPGFSVSRSYYAMFYIAEAFLEGEGQAFSKHSAVIGAFGKDFARTGKVPVEFHRFLLAAQDLRHAGDYDAIDPVTQEQAAEQIARAEQFLAEAQKLIGVIS